MPNIARTISAERAQAASRLATLRDRKDELRAQLAALQDAIDAAQAELADVDADIALLPKKIKDQLVP